MRSPVANDGRCGAPNTLEALHGPRRLFQPCMHLVHALVSARFRPQKLGDSLTASRIRLWSASAAHSVPRPALSGRTNSPMPPDILLYRRAERWRFCSSIERLRASTLRHFETSGAFEAGVLGGVPRCMAVHRVCQPKIRIRPQT